MSTMLKIAIVLGALALADTGQAGALRTSAVSVLGDQSPQCAVVNYRTKEVAVELTIVCDGIVRDGPTVRDVPPLGRGVIFFTNDSANTLCYCALSFPGGSGSIRGTLQVFDAMANAVVDRAEAR